MTMSAPDPDAGRHVRRRLQRSGARRSMAMVIALAAAFTVSACGEGDRPPPTSRPAVVWAVGDGANGSDDARTVVDRIAAEPFDWFLYLGDVYEDGTREDFDQNYVTTYGRLADKTQPTPGNHEWDNREDAYNPYWTQVRGKPIQPWYSFQAGGWELLSLNSEEPLEPGSPQHEWLQSELSEPGTCRLAFFHAARYSASPEHHGDDPELEPLWDTLEGHATLAVSGHDHNMQRFEPVGGITQFVSGAGGNFHYEIEEDDPRLAFSNETDFGALRLELRPGSATYAFVTADGAELDRGTVDCQG